MYSPKTGYGQFASPVSWTQIAVYAQSKPLTMVACTTARMAMT